MVLSVGNIPGSDSDSTVIIRKQKQSFWRYWITLNFKVIVGNEGINIPSRLSHLPSLPPFILWFAFTVIHNVMMNEMREAWECACTFSQLSC